jgi:phage terminase large subunit-like protein
VVFVDGTDQEYLNQICDWTEDAEHDDCPDSLSSLLRVVMAKSRNEGYVSKLY